MHHVIIIAFSLLEFWICRYIYEQWFDKLEFWHQCAELKKNCKKRSIPYETYKGQFHKYKYLNIYTYQTFQDSPSSAGKSQVLGMSLYGRTFYLGHDPPSFFLGIQLSLQSQGRKMIGHLYDHCNVPQKQRPRGQRSGEIWVLSMVHVSHVRCVPSAVVISERCVTWRKSWYLFQARRSDSEALCDVVTWQICYMKSIRQALFCMFGVGNSEVAPSINEMLSARKFCTGWANYVHGMTKEWWGVAPRANGTPVMSCHHWRVMMRSCPSSLAVQSCCMIRQTCSRPCSINRACRTMPPYRTGPYTTTKP
jgi:hypothetical protein